MRLGQILVAAGRIGPAQLDEALRAQVLYGGRLGTNLVELGHVDIEELSLALARQHGIPAALLKHFHRCDLAVQRLLPPALAAEWVVVPIGYLADQRARIAVATIDPLPAQAVAAIGDALHCEPAALVVSVAGELRVRYYLERCYGIPRESRFLRVRRRTQHDIPEAPAWTEDDVSADPADVERTSEASRFEPESAAIVDGNDSWRFDERAPTQPWTSIGRTRTFVRVPPPPGVPSPPGAPPPRAPPPATSGDEYFDFADSGGAAEGREATWTAWPPPAALSQTAVATDIAQRGRPPPRMESSAPPQPAPAAPLAQPQPTTIPSSPVASSPLLGNGRARGAPETALGSLDFEVSAEVDQLLIDERRRRFVPTLSDLDAAAAAAVAAAALEEAPGRLARIPIRRVVHGHRAVTENQVPPETLDEALRAIRRAGRRDRVGDLVATALARFTGADLGATFVVREPIAVGWKAMVRGALTTLDAIAVELDEASVLATACRGDGIVQLDGGTGSALDRRLWNALAAGTPRRVLAAPITFGGQTVCVLYAQGMLPEDAGAVIERIAMSTIAAFGRLLRASQR